jgi:glycosyltransferase involved in cell wall biosynthesis
MSENISENISENVSGKKLRILMIANECNPEWFSVPLLGYCIYDGVYQRADITLVTHGRNQAALEKAHPDRDITYITESKFTQVYARIAQRVSKVGDRIIWPLYNALSYPTYAEFNHRVHQQFKQAVLDGKYDLVHALTPMMPRYPVKIIKACENTPFILGPVNGGVPFPEGFGDVATQEFAYLNFIRSLGRYFIPGYRETYKKASYILSGSTYTLEMIRKLFKLDHKRSELFYENGIKQTFLKAKKNLSRTTAAQKLKGRVSLLFVGRLVPYKGADILLEALGSLGDDVAEHFELSIVGDGSERAHLESLVGQYNLKGKVHFIGWVAQDDTLEYYKKADLFCFPSVREFGGAVVLEAMANGLPCIVVNNGGIGEYVNDDTGIKIEPVSREYVVDELATQISRLIKDTELRNTMSSAAIDFVGKFTWDAKAKDLMTIYQKVLNKK